MKIRERQAISDYAVLDFIGDADTTSMGDVREAIRKATLQKGKIICNMSEVKHINSAGVNAFLLAAKSVIGSEGELVFSAMLPNVERVFKLGRLDKYLKFFPTLKDAEEYFQTWGKVDMSDKDNVLVIEKKNHHIREQLRLIYEQDCLVAPLETYVARTVEQALRFTEKKLFSLALLDATFSMGEGKEFIEQILGAQGQPNLPILVVTTKENIDNAQYFIHSGAHDLIMFPFNPIEVESRLRFMITTSKQMRKS